MNLLKAAGFTGVMLDTMNKRQGSLTQIMDTIALAQFVAQAKGLQLLCGLAGSLRLADIPGLLPLNADYLGFRGALCQEHDRVGPLNEQAVFAVRQSMQQTDVA